MLGTPPLSAVLGAGVDNTDHEAMRAYIRELCKLGLAVMLCIPGTKQPADMRTVRVRNKADKEAAEAARLEGRSNWADVKSASGLALATTDHATILKKNGYLDEYIRKYSDWVDAETGNNPVVAPTAKAIADGEVVMAAPVPINLAIEVGASRVVVVDCDTVAQKQRFLDWAAGGTALPPTVTSPGQRGRDGDPHDQNTWLHSGGGHYYFTLPDDVTVPENLGAITMSGDDGFAILWNRRYVLIPPSTRPEGAYRMTGVDYPIPQPILDEILKAGHARAARAEQYSRDRAHMGDDQISAPGDDFTDAIDAWADATSWADILEPLGWTLASRADNCGCDVWTAGPGHASAKSATAHEAGCSLGRYTEVNTPLHIWTFEPGEPFESWIKAHGSSTMSKLQVVALTQYNDNMGAAMDALGLKPQDELSKAAGIVVGSIEQAAGLNPANLDANPFAGLPLPPRVPGEPASPMLSEPPPAQPPESPFNNLVMSDKAQTVLDRMTPEQRSAAEAHLAKINDALATGGPPPPPWTPANDDGIPPQPAGSAPPDGLADAELDKTGSVTCQCGAIVDGSMTDVMPDADGDWWHEDDDGGHLVSPEPTYADELTPALPTQDSDVPFAAPGDTPRPPQPETPFVDDAGDPDPLVLNTGVFGVPVLAPFDYWRDMPAPEYIIDGLIEHGGLSSIIGPPGMGKSSVALDMACHIATGKRWQGRRTLKQRVVYMPGEGLSGAVQRIKAWEDAHGISVRPNLILADSILKLQASNEAWQVVGEYIIRLGVGFIIFDTFARMSLGVEENSATDVGKAVERFDQVRRYTNAGVLVVHHTAKHSESGRGSSALNGALDSELIVRAGNWDVSQVVDSNGHLAGKPIELDTTKQKNAEQLDHPIPLLMVNWEAVDAPIITGPNGAVDPMQGDVVLARPVPESVIETAIRLRELLDASFPEQGATRSELANYLRMDPHTAGRSDAPKAWRRKVAEAVDAGIRFDLIETLTGTASGGRYIPAGGSIEAARTAYARSIITDNPSGQGD